MKLYDFLKEYGLNANDIKNRLKSNQILVNGEPKEKDYDLGNITHVYEQGFFMQELYKQPFYENHVEQLMFFGIENLINNESNIDNELTEFLSNYQMIQISKDSIIFIKYDNSEDPKETLDIEWNIEGESKFRRTIDVPKEADESELIEKLKKDREKVKKQLSNPGFINNAPKFKVEAAEKRLNNIEAKLAELTNESRIASFADFKKRV